MRRNVAQRIAYCLREMKAIEHVGKQGNALRVSVAGATRPAAQTRGIIGRTAAPRRQCYNFAGAFERRNTGVAAPMNWGAKWLLAATCLAHAAAGADSARRSVSLEILTQPGLPLTASQQWYKTLSDLAFPVCKFALPPQARR